ncbi:MAG: MBOAT family protein [Bacteroidales bacterium]|nr:MBOAT family protein [Bacteroidales bacterium]MCF8387668.1 MBOAT family protein [Bacteroidales bacterium]MCF8398275.1 MBOAT family protein [Bacteroidales bacterium]
MLFNSIEYLIFLPLVVVLYYAISAKWRWLLLLAASYFFYMSWKVEYIVLILASTLVDYYAGLKMSRLKKKSARKKYLLLSIIVNLGILAGFKYFNFFSENMNVLFGEMNIFYRLPELKVLLPVGISFYTFQTMSYSIDIYRGLTKPERHLGKFALYVSFFPQLVAGPIERSRNLLPQIHERKEFDPALIISGLKLILWGFFKKIVIADRIGIFVSSVYASPDENAGIPTILAAVLFIFQLYCDFSGYTDIARGSARLMGYDLMINFRRPLVAKSFKDFWERWHISLTTWFRDYLYFSLPAKYKGRVRMWLLQVNILITFILMGLWHGANWTFLLFGVLIGASLVIEDISTGLRRKFFRITGLNKHAKLQGFLGWIFVFALLILGCIFFRAATISQGFAILGNIFQPGEPGSSLVEILKDKELVFGILQIIILMIAEWYHEKHNLIGKIARQPIYLRWTIYAGFFFYIVMFGIMSNPQEFIYFQF